MAHLLIRRGANPGQRIPLGKEIVILGRSPDCDVPIPSPSISRQHARIVRLHENWFIEDMMSRNGTVLNGQPIQTRTQLHRNDRIRICDFEAVFYEGAVPTASIEVPPVVVEPEGEEAESSSTLTAIATHGNRVFEYQTQDSLKTILHISNNLVRTLELDQLLPRIVECLFEVFNQADRCFVVLYDEATGSLTKEVVSTRRHEDEDTARFSRQIVRQCLEKRQAYLSANPLGGKLVTDQSTFDTPMRSLMCTPLFTADNKPFGAVQIDTVAPAHRFSSNDLKVFVGIVNQASIALHNALAYQEMQRREQMERDLELAGQVQRSILPEQPVSVPGYEFYRHYVSALQVGGDYFDFIPLPHQRLAITMGDVAGKSVPAAILMAKLSSDVRTCLLSESEPAAAVTMLNGFLYHTLSRTDRWITFSVALLDAAQHRVTLVNAGHCPPLLHRFAQNSWEEAMPKRIAGVPLGVVEHPSYNSCQVALDPGDCMVLYTDGVSDALSPQEKQFGVEGIYRALRKDGPYTPQALGEGLVRAVEHHIAGHSQYDDITLVAFGRKS